METDHKPLIPILNSRMLYDLSPQIQAMRMMLLKYSFTATHIPGKDLDDADAFSRALSEENADNTDISDIEGEVNLHLMQLCNSYQPLMQD